jgi:hypothetical protein
VVCGAFPLWGFYLLWFVGLFIVGHFFVGFCGFSTHSYWVLCGVFPYGFFVVGLFHCGVFIYCGLSSMLLKFLGFRVPPEATVVGEALACLPFFLLAAATAGATARGAFLLPLLDHDDMGSCLLPDGVFFC